MNRIETGQLSEVAASCGRPDLVRVTMVDKSYHLSFVEVDSAITFNGNPVTPGELVAAVLAATGIVLVEITPRIERYGLACVARFTDTPRNP